MQTLASEGPAKATDLAARRPIMPQTIARHLALLAEADLVCPNRGQRRRVRDQPQSAPMQVAQQSLAALARRWDGPHGARADHLDRTAREPVPAPRNPNMR